MNQDTEVFAKFLAPIMTMVTINNMFSRQCSSVDDLTFLRLGILRVLQADKSGRSFVQSIVQNDIAEIELNTFFKTMKSERRLNYLKNIYDEFALIATRDLEVNDIFKDFKELAGMGLFAGDGSYHEHASHDEKFSSNKVSETNDQNERNENHKSTKRAVQHYYSIDLRSNLAHHLTVAKIGGIRKKENDMHALKRLEAKILRMGVPKGKKVLHVYDKAGIDYKQWIKWKNQNGIYFLSKEKSNGNLLFIESLEFDKDDPVNFGVIANDLVDAGDGNFLRRVHYQCPETNEKYSFVTTLSSSIRPGVIAMLYKLRWDIEKVFDVFKNKLEEKKAWGSSDITKTIQALFICITHNLTLLMNKKIEKEEKVIYTYDIERKEKNLNSKQTALDEKKIPYTSTWKISLRVSQFTIKFYRWLRNFVFIKGTSWDTAISKLRLVYEAF